MLLEKKVAIVTAKDKLRALLGHGLKFDEGRAICFSSERSDTTTKAAQASRIRARRGPTTSSLPPALPPATAASISASSSSSDTPPASSLRSASITRSISFASMAFI